MNKRFGLLTVAALVAGISIVSDAASVKKNMPKPQDVLSILKEKGAPHYVDKMKVYKIGTIETGEDTYYHFFRGQLKDVGYRVIVFDNTPAYMGYYETTYEPSDYDDEAILFDSGETSAEGEPVFFKLTIPSTGPADKARIGSFPTTLVRVADAKQADVATATTPGSTTLGVPSGTKTESNEPQYREWTITVKGKEVKVRALYVSQDFGKVTIKSEATGADATLMISSLSTADQEYVKTMK